jgi:DNA-binding transcriptional ArsR family regulator
MEYSISAVAEPNRRAILGLLAAGECSVGDIEAALKLPQPTVSKHLRVLRDAGFVDVTVDAQRRVYRLKTEPLQAFDAWLAPFRRIWSGHMDALERHLEGMEPRKPSRNKTAVAPKRRQPRISKRAREAIR